MLTTILRLAVLLLAVTAAVAAAPADAKVTTKKALFGPVTFEGGLSAFERYREMGVGVFQAYLRWDDVAPRKPRSPRNPRDGRYRWSEELDVTLAEARENGIKVALTVIDAPRWATGGGSRTSPRRAEDLGDFLRAASRRFPRVAIWRIWEEPNVRENWSPMTPEKRGRRLTRTQQQAPRRYARMLDRAYGELKRLDAKDLVIGGNTSSSGDVSPANWIEHMQLPGGRPPRMDVYGHNPVGVRPPPLFGQPHSGFGFAELPDTPYLLEWLDDFQRPKGRAPLRVFYARFSLPSGHRSRLYDFFLTDEQQGDLIRRVMVDVRRSKRLYGFGWDTWRDEQPTPDGLEVRSGLVDAAGTPKPSYAAFAAG